MKPMRNTRNRLTVKKTRVGRLSSFGDVRTYFSYGSNMVLDEMADRCPAARFLGRARLKDHEFRICRSGYATVVPKRGTTVHGVIWLLNRRDERALDTYEQIGSGLYRKTLAWFASTADVIFERLSIKPRSVVEVALAPATLSRSSAPPARYSFRRKRCRFGTVASLTQETSLGTARII